MRDGADSASDTAGGGFSRGCCGDKGTGCCCGESTGGSLLAVGVDNKGDWLTCGCITGGDDEGVTLLGEAPAGGGDLGGVRIDGGLVGDACATSVAVVGAMSLNTHFRSRQGILSVPGPPNLGMLRQARHWPQFGLVQGPHSPQRLRRLPEDGDFLAPDGFRGVGEPTWSLVLTG